MKCPSQLDLVELWLQTHYKNISCAVFFHPSNGVNQIRDICIICGVNSRIDAIHMLTGEIYVFPITEDRITQFVNSLDQAVYGYVMAWDGSKFITHN